MPLKDITLKKYHVGQNENRNTERKIRKHKVGKDPPPQKKEKKAEKLERK